ncbi:Nrap protein [Multifurca ochricompacta]|uniref:U3 small nucleolar RNA-associated protein 22 n=1 Tax=Multifurca ochricompacta TaxID=376703 RepID=A0AAD4M545_9AGAM|nr:Nrap protein [Multifurca ochricompacta]
MKELMIMKKANLMNLANAGEEEVWSGILPNGVGHHAQGHTSGGKADKTPTGAELSTIKMAQELFVSSSFKLQIDALLPNVRPKCLRKQLLDSFLFSLHAYLSSLPPLILSIRWQPSRRDGKSATLGIVSIPYPLPVPTEDANWKVAFEKPANITVVGSWINNVSVKSKDDQPWVVDLAVEMPSGLFQEKDYMNGRFFHKRAFYLAVIAKLVSEPASKLNVDAFYESKRCDPRLTTLILQPKHGKTTADFSHLNTVIRIIPTLSTSSPIRLARLSPARSNFRVHLPDAVDSGPKHLPTPLYNAILMLASSPQRDVLSVNALKNDIPAYRDALSLLRVWANQRGYGEGRRPCIYGFEGAASLWNAVLELVIRGEEPYGKMNTRRYPLGGGLSSYQLFKAALDFIFHHDFSNKPVFVKSKDGHLFPPEEYLGENEAVLVGSSSCSNVLAGIPLTSIYMLQHDAWATLEVLDSNTSKIDPFTEVFLTDHRDLVSRFDVILSVDLSSASPRRLSIHDVYDNGSFSSALIASLSTYLRKALGPRVKALAILHPSSQPRPISQGLPASHSTVFLGLILDPEYAFRLVDHGPGAAEAQSHMTEAFRELWGSKAELRRFQDGSITESVVWHVLDSDERAHIPAMIVRHILEEHFGIREDAVTSWQFKFDALLRLPPFIASQCRAAGFRAALASFQKLASSIKALGQELPLAVINISPIAPELRYTSVFAPISVPVRTVSTPRPYSRYVPLMPLNLEFEKSARWPDDLVAIQKMKLAFLERLAQVLAKAIPGLHARIAITLPPGVPTTADHAQLEITTPDGWAFSLRVWHDREATLLDRVLHASNVSCSSHDLENAHIARRLYTRRFIAAPLHHRAVAALYHRFVAFGGTVRLVKRWLAAHWLLRLHVSEEAVEVLCAAVFVGVGLAQVPTTRERGFACVVRLLRDWNWLEGMSVMLYGISEQRHDTYSSAVSGAKGVWMLKTEADPDGRMWTMDSPDVVAALRVRALAQATHAYLQGIESGLLDVSGMFVHPEDDYDFVVKLQPTVHPRHFQNITADPSVWAKNRRASITGSESSSAPLRLGFDPVEMYLDDLTVPCLRDTAKFFYDPLGGDRFGGIWDPSITRPVPFRVMNRFSSIPVPKEHEKGKGKDRNFVNFNESAVLSEIVRMGEGLVIGSKAGGGRKK